MKKTYFNFFRSEPISDILRLLNELGGRKLYFYGWTIGWFGIGIIVGKEAVKRKEN